MTPATLQHWLPRVADQIISALSDEHAAIDAGDNAAANDAASDVQTFATLAWRAISRARPAHIATPRMRTSHRRNDITIHHTRVGDHLAFPPRNARPVR